MSIKCGEYQHFKGNLYTVYGVAIDCQNKEFVLYQQNYGNNAFWIRPISMFIERIYDNGQNVQRFKLINEMPDENAITNLVNILRNQSIAILHTETEEKYKIFFIGTESKKIVIIPYESYSSYLTDTQIAWRMGYDFYKIDKDIYIHPTSFAIPEDKKLIIKIKDVVDDSDKEYEDKKIIKDLNACSVDLHISDHFFSKAKHKTIDIASMMHFSVKASELWKEIHPKNINGFNGIAIKPGQTIITHTLEKIELPSDCAGKIEIKSTYARLALTVTASDFCNPEWKGFFPLAITNNGKHKIILHPKEEMLQLLLVQTDGYIVNEYQQKATYMNDDGTPFKFWHAQTVKHLQNERYSDEILEFYKKVLESINPTNSENPDEAKKRFEDTFLLFCENKLKSVKYNSIRNSYELLKVIWNGYRRKETTHKFLVGNISKFLIFIITMLPSIVVACIELFVNNQLNMSLLFWLGISLIIAIGIVIALNIFAPKCFCTFERLEFDRIYQNKNP